MGDIAAQEDVKLEEHSDDHGEDHVEDHIGDEDSKAPHVDRALVSSELRRFMNCRSVRMFNFMPGDIFQKPLSDFLRQAPYVFIELSRPSTALRLRFQTEHAAEHAFEELKKFKFGRPTRVIFDREQEGSSESVVVDETGEIVDTTEQQGGKTYMGPLLRRLLVCTDLPASLTDANLVQAFPNAVGAWISRDLDGQLKGYAFLEMHDQQAAREFLDKHEDGVTFGEHTLKVTRLQLPRNRPYYGYDNRPRGYRGRGRPWRGGRGRGRSRGPRPAKAEPHSDGDAPPPKAEPTANETS